jgi:hypothetical protein
MMLSLGAKQINPTLIYQTKGNIMIEKTLIAIASLCGLIIVVAEIVRSL